MATLRSGRSGSSWISTDGKLAAQYEHTVAVTAGGCEVLTHWNDYVAEAPTPA